MEVTTLQGQKGKFMQFLTGESMVVFPGEVQIHLVADNPKTQSGVARALAELVGWQNWEMVEKEIGPVQEKVADYEFIIVPQHLSFAEMPEGAENLMTPVYTGNTLFSSLNQSEEFANIDKARLVIQGYSLTGVHILFAIPNKGVLTAKISWWQYEKLKSVFAGEWKTLHRSSKATPIVLA